MFKPDLTHSDWCLFTQEKLIQNTVTDVSITYYKKANGTTNMTISGIKPADIAKLKFLTNTDQNNNYLYLEQFNVYINNGFNPLVIPGLNEVIQNFFRNSDMMGYLDDKKTHLPFSNANIQSGQNVAKTFNEFIILGTKLIPYIPNITPENLNTTVKYEIILCPDRDGIQKALGSSRGAKISAFDPDTYFLS
jgi:hypothetical protein